MNILKQWKRILTAIVVIIAVFIITSFGDYIFSIMDDSNLLSIVVFGVGGAFAAFFSFGAAMKLATEKNELDELARWSAIITIILAGLLFFFLISKAFGVTLALTTLLFMKGKVEDWKW